MTARPSIEVECDVAERGQCREVPSGESADEHGTAIFASEPEESEGCVCGSRRLTGEAAPPGAVLRALEFEFSFL